jgi:hypothetical protein
MNFLTTSFRLVDGSLFQPWLMDHTSFIISRKLIKSLLLVHYNLQIAHLNLMIVPGT